MQDTFFMAFEKLDDKRSLVSLVVFRYYLLDLPNTYRYWKPAWSLGQYTQGTFRGTG
jgi:hypothetical protein